MKSVCVACGICFFPYKSLKKVICSEMKKFIADNRTIDRITIVHCTSNIKYLIMQFNYTFEEQPNTTIISSSNNLFVIVSPVIKVLSQYLLNLFLIIGNISCLLSLIVFLQKPMLKSSSGLYFLASTICNIIFINTMITGPILYLGFDINPTGNILFFCQLQFYIAFVTSAVSSTFLVLASIDRFIISLSNFTIHRFIITRSMAAKFIIDITIFWCIVHIHIFFFIIQQKEDHYLFYYMFQAGTYTLVIIFNEFIIHDFLLPMLMIFFSLRMVLNVRRVMVNPASRLHSADRQLIQIMLSQCCIYVSFRLPLLTCFIYDNIIKASTKNIPNWNFNINFCYISLIWFFLFHIVAFSFQI